MDQRAIAPLDEGVPAVARRLEAPGNEEPEDSGRARHAAGGRQDGGQGAAHQGPFTAAPAEEAEAGR